MRQLNGNTGSMLYINEKSAVCVIPQWTAEVMSYEGESNAFYICSKGQCLCDSVFYSPHIHVLFSFCVHKCCTDTFLSHVEVCDLE